MPEPSHQQPHQGHLHACAIGLHDRGTSMPVLGQSFLARLGARSVDHVCVCALSGP